MGLTVKASSELETRTGQVHVVSAGHGPTPLLAITPIGASWMVATMPAGLEELFTIHLMELPGTGRSSIRSGRPSVETTVAAIHDAATTLEAPILFGHSMNGTLTLAAATQSACAGVIAVTPPPCLPPDPSAATAYWELQADSERKRRGRELVEAYEAATDDDERRSLQERYDRLRRWYELDFDPADVDRLAEMNLDWVRSVFESGQNLDWAQTIRDVNCPVLLALGAHDFVAPPSAWTAAITPPHWTVHRFERSGHTPYLEESDEFVRVTSTWLTGLD